MSEEEKGGVVQAEPTAAPDQTDSESTEETPAAPDQALNGSEGDSGEVDRETQFKTLANSEYKDESTKYFKSLLDKRFKSHDAKMAEQESQLEGFNEVLSAFGVDSIEALRERGRTESAKKKAYDQGIPEEVAIAHEEELARILEENTSLKGIQKKAKADEYLSSFETGISELSSSLGIDTLELLMDDDLVAATKEGKTVKQAFYSLYPDKVDAAYSKSSKAKAPRPAENIAGGSKPSNKVPTPTAREMMERIALAKSSGRAVDPNTGNFVD